MDTINLKGWTAYGVDNTGNQIFYDGPDSNPHTKQFHVNMHTGIGTVYQNGKIVGQAKIAGFAPAASPAPAPTPQASAAPPVNDQKRRSLVDLVRGRSKGAASAVDTSWQAATPPSATHHTSDDLAHQQKDVAFHGATGVTKNIFTDGSAAFVKDGKVLGREAAGTETPPPHQHVPVSPPASQPVAYVPTPTDHGGGAAAPVTHHDPSADLVSEHGQSGGHSNHQLASADSAAGPTSEHSQLGSFISDNSPAAQPHHQSPSSDLISEHGQGGGFIPENSPAAQPHAQLASAPVPAWHQDIAPDLGGIGGSGITDHGSALATRDSRDGSKIIAQMSDGTFESIDKTTGAVAGAGNWGDGHGGGIGVNGIGNPTPPPAPPSEPQPSINVVSTNVPTLPAGDATTTPSPGIAAIDPSSVATNVHHPGRMMME